MINNDRPWRLLLATWGTWGVLLGVGPAFGQEAPESGPPPSGALRVETIRSGLVVSPDFKVTRIDDGDGALVGVYGGFMTDRRLLIGAGAYWLADGPDDLDLTYGGGLVEWFGNPRGRVDFSVRGLAGFGTARLGTDVGAGEIGPFGRSRFSRFGRRPPFGFGSRFPVAFRHRQEFFIAEPQASIHLNVTEWLRLGGGVGYRFIGAAGADRDRLQGVTANVGLQIGPP